LVLAMAVAQAALQTPQANSTWNGDTYTLHHYVNLGLAAATERGLIVPNIKNAHELNERQMAEAIQELTQRAREANLSRPSWPMAPLPSQTSGCSDWMPARQF